MDYADKIDMMDDDCCIEWFPMKDFDFVILDEFKNRLKSAWVYEIVKDNFIYFPRMKHLWHWRVDFSMINEFAVWELIHSNNL